REVLAKLPLMLCLPTNSTGPALTNAASNISARASQPQMLKVSTSAAAIGTPTTDANIGTTAYTSCSDNSSAGTLTINDSAISCPTSELLVAPNEVRTPSSLKRSCSWPS